MKRRKASSHRSPEAVDRFLLGIGYGNFVAVSKVIAVLTSDSAPVKRLIHEAKEEGKLLDATYGRLTRSVVVMESGHVILSAVNPDTIAHRRFLS